MTEGSLLLSTMYVAYTIEGANNLLQLTIARTPFSDYLLILGFVSSFSGWLALGQATAAEQGR